MLPDLTTALAFLKDFGALGGLLAALYLFIKLVKVLKNGNSGIPLPVTVTLPLEYIEQTRTQTQHLGDIFKELQEANKVTRSTRTKIAAVHTDLKLAMTRQKNIYKRIPKTAAKG